MTYMSKQEGGGLKGAARWVLGTLYHVPKALATIVYEERIHPRVSSLGLRVGTFWNKLKEDKTPRGE
mgnify:CR=1 FL=1